MSFVHWLPKNWVRHLAILFYVLIKREPFWPELNDDDLLSRANVYYNYSINKTYYRSPKRLTNIFSKTKFTIKHGGYYVPDMPLNKTKSKRNIIIQYFRTIFNEEELYLMK